MTCGEDIEENHLGAGNEYIRTCPTEYDSMCEVPLKSSLKFHFLFCRSENSKLIEN